MSPRVVRFTSCLSQCSHSRIPPLPSPPPSSSTFILYFFTIEAVRTRQWVFFLPRATVSSATLSKRQHVAAVNVCALLSSFLRPCAWETGSVTRIGSHGWDQVLMAEQRRRVRGCPCHCQLAGLLSWSWFRHSPCSCWS